MNTTHSQIIRSINPDKTQNFAGEFLERQSKMAGSLYADMDQTGIITNYSILSVAPVIKWMCNEALKSYKTDGIYDSRIIALILHSAYYMGESFVRLTPCLKWETGTEGFPEVTGWKYNLKMSPIMEAYELFDEILLRNKAAGAIEKKILTWLIAI